MSRDLLAPGTAGQPRRATAQPWPAALRGSLRERLRKTAGLRLFAHAHQQLAEILALQQPEERLRRVLQAFDHVFLVFDLALLQPRGDVASERLGLIREIPDDEAADGAALGQHLAEQLRRAVGASLQLR